MRRRELIACLPLLLTAPSAFAQKRIPRIGVLAPGGPAVTWMSEGLREGLGGLGYADGENIRLEYRWAHGDFDRLSELAAELLRLDIDGLVTQATQASLVAKGATSTVPIVMVGVADPVGVGLVPSLARPGGNVTGTSNVAAEIVGKQIELLRQADPSLSSIAVLWNPANHVFQRLQLTEAEAAARAFGLRLQLLEARSPEHFETAFASMRAHGQRGLLVLVDPVFSLHRAALLDHIFEDRLIAASGVREFAEAGGLFAYGPSYAQSAKRAAIYIDRILKGAKPSDLPVEQPTTFELVINVRTARSLGVEIDPALLARADEVIE